MTRGKRQGMPRPRYLLPITMVWLMFALSLIPTLLLVTSITKDLRRQRTEILRKAPVLGPLYSDAAKWYSDNVKPVQELRALNTLPNAWLGRWLDVDKNYAGVERWFADNLGLRDLLIRSKNEVDYRLFRSSSRVYFGRDDYIYGRQLIDFQLPATEAVLATPDSIDSVQEGLVRLTEKLQAEGITPVYVFPMQKEYLVPDNMPFFAPRLPQNSRFMSFYNKVKADRRIHFVDVFGILKELRGRYPIYYKQDFHWTDISALAVASDVTNRIANMENSSVRWDHPIKVVYKATVGSDARFAGRLDAKETILEPELDVTWKSIHERTNLDVKQAGLEFETDFVDRSDLLPPTCMFGNSFSDGMLYAGLTEYFQKFTKLDRARPLTDVPHLAKGRCKYVIVQVLDIQPAVWTSLKQ